MYHAIQQQPSSFNKKNNALIIEDKKLKNVQPEKLHPKHRSVTILILRRNQISNLEWLRFFHSVVHLSLEGNTIENVSELVYLNYLPNLTTLDLRQNPIEKIPYYRAQIIHFAHKCLQVLDETPITKSERVAASESVALYQNALRKLVDAYIANMKLHRMEQYLTLFTEMRLKLPKSTSHIYTCQRSLHVPKKSTAKWTSMNNIPKMLSIWNVESNLPSYIFDDIEDSIAKALTATPISQYYMLINAQRELRLGAKVSSTNSWEDETISELYQSYKHTSEKLVKRLLTLLATYQNTGRCFHASHPPHLVQTLQTERKVTLADLKDERQKPIKASIRQRHVQKTSNPMPSIAIKQSLHLLESIGTPEVLS